MLTLADKVGPLQKDANRPLTSLIYGDVRYTVQPESRLAPPITITLSARILTE